MAIRTVRLDDDAEAALRQICEATGLPISEALKRGLRSLREHAGQEMTRTPWDVYQEIDPGPGGYAITPSTETQRGVKQAIGKKLHRDDRR